MAAITSSTSGAFSSTATWTGGAVPTSADTWTIQNTHTVTIDGTFPVSGTYAGDCTIASGGTLKANRSTSSTLNMGHVNLVNNGTVDYGLSSSDYIASTATAKINWTITADNAKGISGSGNWYFYGDKNYWGGTAYKKKLYSAWNGSDTHIHVKGDATTGGYNWKVGNELVVWKGNAYGSTNDSYQTAFAHAEISTVGAYDSTSDSTTLNITISGTPNTTTTWAANTGEVWNIGRNVQLLNAYATTKSASGNLTYWTKGANTGYIFADNLYVWGMKGYALLSKSLNQCVGLNCSFGASNIYNSTNSIFTNGAGSVIVKIINSLNCDFIAISSLFGYSAKGYLDNCTFVGSDRIISGTYGPAMVTIHKGNIYGCSNVAQNMPQLIDVIIGTDWDGQVTNNTTEVAFPNYCNSKHLNCIYDATPTISNQGIAQNYGRYSYEYYDAGLNDHRITEAQGDIQLLAADGSSKPTKDGAGTASGLIWEIVPKATCNTYDVLDIIPYYEPVRIWCTTSNTTITFKLYTNYTTLAKTNVKLYARYYDSGHRLTVAESTDTGNYTSQTDWETYEDLSVTIAPHEDSWVDCWLIIKQYESSKKIWIDPKFTVS